MKQIISNDEWIINIDVEKTKNYYSNRKNFSGKVYLDKYPDNLKEFFNQCGIDYEKPCNDNTEDEAKATPQRAKSVEIW